MCFHFKKEPSPEYPGLGAFARSLENYESRKPIVEKPKSRRESWRIQKRKKYFLRTRDRRIKKRMIEQHRRYYPDLDSSSNIIREDCAFDPCPPEKPDGTLEGGRYITFWWRDHLNRLHRYDVNIGILGRILKSGLTETQIAGIIDHAWHTSHLCGNSTCLNWRHFWIESGSTNGSRRRCHKIGFRGKCQHFPRCMRERKRRLLVTQSIRNEIFNCIITIQSFPSSNKAIMDIIDKVYDCNRWEMCRLCKKVHRLAPFCAVLDSLKDCRALLVAIRSLRRSTEEIEWITGNLEMIKEDLELRDRLRQI